MATKTQPEIPVGMALLYRILERRLISCFPTILFSLLLLCFNVLFQLGRLALALLSSRANFLEFDHDDLLNRLIGVHDRFPLVFPVRSHGCNEVLPKGN